MCVCVCVKLLTIKITKNCLPNIREAITLIFFYIFNKKSVNSKPKLNKYFDRIIEHTNHLY